MTLSTNTTYRVLVEKLGASDPNEFIGNEGELFYDPSVPSIYLSDGSTAGGLEIAGGGGGGQWTNTVNGIYYNGGNVAIGTNVVGSGSTTLLVDGNARITGILTIGTSSITLDPSNNTITASGINIIPGVGSTTVDSDTSKFIANYKIPRTYTYTYFSSARFDSQGKVVCSGADGYDGVPFVIKFDTDGSIIWKKFFEHSDPDKAYKVGEAIAVDKNDDSIYTGILCDDTVNSGFLVKLDSSGTILWQKEVAFSPSYGFPCSIAVASSGNVYFAVNDYDSSLGFAIIKFDSDGNEIWQRMLALNGNGDPGQVAVDSDENVYFTCDYVYNNTTSSYDLTLVKLDSNGNGLWQRNIDGGEGNDFAYGVAIDSQNNPYLVGSFWDNDDYSYNSTLIKFDSSGNVVWQRTFETPKSEEGFSIAIDENDIICIAASMSPSPKITLSSFDSDGNLLRSNIITSYGGNLDWWWYNSYNHLDVSNGKIAAAIWRYSSIPQYNYRGELIFLPIIDENINGYYGTEYEYKVESYDPVVSTTIFSVDNTAISITTPTFSITSGALTEIVSPPSDVENVNYRYIPLSTFDFLEGNTIKAEKYRLSRDAVFSTPNNRNLTVVSSTKSLNSDSSNNVFFGLDVENDAYECNYVVSYNTFVGNCIGLKNCGNFNSFFGSISGLCNIGGSENSFFGTGSGQLNTTGTKNSFFGVTSGLSNSTGILNSYFGYGSGSQASTGSHNVALGANSTPYGYASQNVIIGSSTCVYVPFTPPNVGNCQLAIGIKDGFYPANYWITGNSYFNVGFGVNDPQYRVDVCGDINFTGTLYQNGSPFGGGGFSYCCSSNITSTCLTSHGFINNACYNLFAGFHAGYSITDGSFNNFLGFFAGDNTSNGYFNNFLGSYAGYCNTTGERNNYLGPAAGKYSTTGSNNNFFGSLAGFRNSGSGSNNNFLGSLAGAYNCGCFNNYIGYYAGGGTFTGNASNNNFIGSCAGFNICCGSHNNFMGCGAGFNNTCGNHNNFFGQFAGQGNLCGNNNTFIGQCAGLFNTGGSCNHFFGKFAGFCNTTGSHNFFLGIESGYFNTSGCHNTFIGNDAGFNNISGSSNIYIGNQAGYTSCYATNNIFLGDCAGRSNSSDNNIFFGYNAGRYNTTGNHNNFFGCNAGRNNISGYFNIFMGFVAGYNNTSGASNTFLSAYAGSSNTVGSYNNFIGNGAGQYNTTGCFNNFIGNFAGTGNATGSNNNAFGYNSGNDAVYNFGVSGGSNRIVMGNNSSTNAYIKIAWTVTSDERDKNIVGIVSQGLSFVQQINPIEYQWKNRETNEITDESHRYGLSAQELLQLEGDHPIIVDNENSENLKVRETMLIPVLINAIKEQQKLIENLQERVSNLENSN